MNDNQRFVLIGAIAVMVAMLLFPPFSFRLASGLIVNMGYAPLWAPPTYIGTYSSFASSVNVTMLGLQWAGALIVSALLWFVFRDR